MKNHSRYLTTALAATAFLACSPSYALGIGNIKLQSALNQNLKAEIALTLADGENPADFKIGLAPITKFDEAGIPWTVFLSKIQFQIVTENGKTIIKLSSKEALKEPFLDFVVEIKSPKNNVFREFTTLVDPPEDYKIDDAPKTITVSTLPQRFITAPEKNPVQTLPTRTIAKPKLKIKPKVAQPAAKPKIKNPPVSDQKVIELGKQIAEMKQMLLEQNVQIMALKNGSLTPPVVAEKTPAATKLTSAPVTPVTTPISTPVVTPAPATKTEEIASILPPVVLGATPTISEMSSVVVSPAPPVVEPVKIQPVAESPDLMTEVFNLVKTASADSHYYIAGAASSLLLSLLGWLRLKNRRKTRNEEPADEPKSDITLDNETVKIEDVPPAIEEGSYFLDQATSKMFDDDNGENIAFDDAALSQFDALVENKTNDQTDILYKADVYCAYGSHDKAIALLQDEFKKHPDIEDYALKLLTLYVSQDDKFEFKEFVHELARLGKKENLAFWTHVTDVARDFDPEALFFVASPAMPNDENAPNGAFHHELNFDVMRFDHEMTTEQINDEFSPKIVPLEEDIDVEEFVFSNLPVTEKKDEFSADFDFTAFEVKEEAGLEKIVTPEFDAAFDLDFTTFDIEKEAVVEEPPFLSDAEFDLDFTTFDIEKEAVVEEPPFLSDAEFDLDFTTFDIEKEAVVEKDLVPEFDMAFDLDFTMFDVKDDEVAKAATDETFDFSAFSMEKEPSSDKIK
jgi:Tfp pilus assembly protein FimV